MILKRGIESPEVVNLELVLQGMGFEGFDVNGIFDEKTENIIKYIQKANGFVGKDVDGIVGPRTFELLDRLYEPTKANFAPAPVIELPSPAVAIAKDNEELLRVHPILANKVLAVLDLALAEGYRLTVVQGLRTFAEQDKLFAKRPRVTKARGGQSYHNYGVAVDLAFVKNDKVVWEPESLYKNIGRWASQVGLTWGGHWKFVDYPHLQLLNMPAVGKLLVAYNRAGGRDAGVKEVWRTFVR